MVDDAHEMPKHTIRTPHEMRGFSLRLAQAIKESELTQKEIERASGVSQGAISKLTAERPGGGTLAHIILVAKALNVRVGWLAVGEEPMRAHGIVAPAAPASPVVVDADAARKRAPHVQVRAKNNKR